MQRVLLTMASLAAALLVGGMSAETATAGKKMERCGKPPQPDYYDLRAKRVSCKEALKVEKAWVDGLSSSVFDPVKVKGFRCEGSNSDRKIKGSETFRIVCGDGRRRIRWWIRPYHLAAARMGGKPTVACYNPPRDQVGFKVKPKKCIFLKRGGEGFSFETLKVTDLKWKHWGRAQVKGKGTAQGNMGFEERVVVHLSKPKSRCDQRAYSVAKFDYPDFDYSAPRMPLYTCKK